MTNSTNGALTELYSALKAPRRRHVIRLLANTTPPQYTTRELARQISSLEYDIPIDHATGEPYRNAYNALSQTHLPTLHDAGVIIYDSQRQRCYPGPSLHIAALLLDIDTPVVRRLSTILSTENADTHNDS